MTLRSGGQGSATTAASTPPIFRGNNAPAASDASSGPWTNVSDGAWVPFSNNVYYDEAAAQWKGKQPGWVAGKGNGFSQRLKLSRNEDEAVANLNFFQEQHPNFVFEPKAVESEGTCSSELYSFNLLKLPPPPRAAILVLL